ncbi:MAG: 50S ribosomal protein L4 [Ruminococcaceae bacterium]|nr:50S ribosomal protein L4 [Oscillospiraceae bacterium]
MAKLDLYNMSGEKTGTIDVKDEIFGVEVKKSVLHDVVVNYLANQRQGTQSALTRTEVRGGGIKPWRQKGTGRARQGSIRAPQWTGGGVVFAPKPRDYSYRLNKKVKALALKMALSSKVASEDIIVVDGLKFDEIKTSAAAKMLSALGVSDKALVVSAANDINMYKSVRNIEGVCASNVDTLNVYEILNHKKFIIAKDAVEKIEEVCAQ